ncbi:hypothetical protein DDB_G0270386 [Dictyostelium discoideum AX4]|uniref:Tr-type G domain-containing protein n=1 Tax=Dictyostelium discoideum TaxID=44689 RepID=Q55BS5_DICDI|nr:hypothetical protein DDB_G0270386 [Dictyostelium discoideum AX4]EAL72543.1 hypothetical protein DDB_G0270386 [Dictyostelium discoideum AX4]|eukprot:XP_646756.1 hypothetical protein DDB_G0270386 [Dictyostelium discoideum AX4]
MENTTATATTTTTTTTPTTTTTTSTSPNNNNNNEIPINFNIGIMGHVDSGKTSLAKALSTNLSTASLDKSPASQERGITLDLGFSSFQIKKDKLAENNNNNNDNNNNIQITLVDCPGHASLIKTIIGGSQIIDMMFLVIDIVKGIQTQTAECIVIGEITCKKGIIILNKIDQIPVESRKEKIEQVSSKLRKALEKTCFKDSLIIPFSATGGSSSGGGSNSNKIEPIGIDLLTKELLNFINIPKREAKGDLLFEFDHCFQIKGQGTILTGTVLRGSIEVNQIIQIPQLNIEKKVKSMQMFHKPIKKAIQGDRVGVCITQLDSSLLERGLVCSNNSIPLLSSALISIEKVRFYKQQVNSKQQFHITIGHSTVIGTITLFSSNIIEPFNSIKEYIYEDTLHATTINTSSNDNNTINSNNVENKESFYPVGSQFALIKFDHPILCPLNSVVIGSKLDVNLDSTGCRIAFHGNLLEGIDDTNKQSLFSKLKIYKNKSKQGQVERIHNENTIIGKNLFKKDSDISSFIGMKVLFETGEIGILDSSFGKTGKVKIQIQTGNTESIKLGTIFTLTFKRFI